MFIDSFYLNSLVLFNLFTDKISILAWLCEFYFLISFLVLILLTRMFLFNSLFDNKLNSFYPTNLSLNSPTSKVEKTTLNKNLNSNFFIYPLLFNKFL